MASFPLSKFGDNLPVTLAFGFSQAVAGLGAGLLLAGRLKPEARSKLGVALLVAGAAAVTPVIVGAATHLSNRPHSSRRMRQRLDSIRQDTGLSEIAEAS